MNKQILFEKAKALGIEALEVYTQTKETLKIAVYEGTVDSFHTSRSSGTAVRGIYNGKVGNTYTEEPVYEDADAILRKVIEQAQTISSSDLQEFFAGSTYPELQCYSPALKEKSVEDIIALLQYMEQTLLAKDPRITKVSHCAYSQADLAIEITNSLGLDASRKLNYGALVIECIVNEEEDTQSHYDYLIIRDFDTIDVDAFLTQVSKEAIAKLHAGKVPSSSYPTILKNTVMSDLLDALTSLFSADLVQKGISVLKDKLDTVIFDEKLTMIEDPHLANGYASTPFDDEGVPTLSKTVVDHGKLLTYFHNLKTAKKDGVKPTGNGFKASYASTVGVNPTNFYVQPSATTLEDMIAGIDRGILITEVAGLHAGLNAVTTDFSLQASGFFIEHGAIIKPVNLITVAGNFMTMMKQIDAIGNDLKFESSGIGSPSVLFHSLQISGE